MPVDVLRMCPSLLVPLVWYHTQRNHLLKRALFSSKRLLHAVCKEQAMKLLPGVPALYLVLHLLPLGFTAAPWPYLQIYPGANATDDRTPLYFALMLSTARFPSIQALPGVQLALDYINNEPSILPNYSLHYTLSDSQVRSLLSTVPCCFLLR